jgi:hypothetical protein
MERDGFTCQFCRNDKSELQVHHLCYRKGSEPWDYEDDELKTLCCDCHESVKMLKEAIVARLDHPCNIRAFMFLCAIIDKGEARQGLDTLSGMAKKIGAGIIRRKKSSI